MDKIPSYIKIKIRDKVRYDSNAHEPTISEVMDIYKEGESPGFYFARLRGGVRIEVYRLTKVG